MALADILRYLPLASAAVWFAICAFQIYRDRIHTFTEVFFLAGCASAGLYAVADFAFFTATSLGVAELAIGASFSFVILSMLFMFLFTVVYVARMRRVYWAFFIPAGALLIVAWIEAVLEQGAAPSQGGTLYEVQFNQLASGLIIAYIVLLGAGGIVNLYRVHRIVKASSEALARRTRALVFIFGLVLALGLPTNGYYLIHPEIGIPPPFSSLLLLVGIAAFFALNPGSAQRISQVMRRFQSQYYRAQAAFLIYRDGTLIGAEGQVGGKMIDQDLFSATLDVIQNFMKTSFPALRGFLRTIKHGDYTLVLERGRWAYMAVVITGDETDQLRRQMRDQLREFESLNHDQLEHWRGVPSDALATETTLQSVLTP